jgi:hypothetical protein
MDNFKWRSGKSSLVSLNLGLFLNLGNRQDFGSIYGKNDQGRGCFLSLDFIFVMIIPTHYQSNLPQKLINHESPFQIQSMRQDDSTRFLNTVRKFLYYGQPLLTLWQRSPDQLQNIIVARSEQLSPVPS